MSGTLFLGTFPPRRCGIATFTADVVAAFDEYTESRSDVVAMDDATSVAHAYSPSVIARLMQDDASAYARGAGIINAHPADVLNIQHEYGIFGGQDGDRILELLLLAQKAKVLTLHTVVPDPPGRHKTLTQLLCAAVDRVVVLSETARKLLLEKYGVAGNHIRVIPHGIPSVPFVPSREEKVRLGFGDRFVLSTFGLIGRGKGLENAIDALAMLARKRRDVLYVIVGATHPAVLRSEGESYRAELQARVAAHGLQRNVLMVNEYLALPQLLRYLIASDAYVMPYLNPAQVVSGTLAFAMGAGRAVISTPFLYARELLEKDRGVLVPFDDVRALAAAFERLSSDENLRVRLGRSAYDFTRRMTWPNVGRLYAGVVTQPHAQSVMAS